MLRTSESESEILLDNKQLLGIFFVVALLLAVAFYGGYMVGRGAAAKGAAVAGTQEEAATATASGGGGETHVVPAAAGTSPESSSTEADGNSAKTAERSDGADEPPLGSPNRKSAVRRNSPDAAGANAGEAFAPQVGQQFLQVAAVSRDEAEALADVLHKKGFRAHAVPKPGNSKIYRVIIGPIRDTADLSSTRDALMRTGFREVIPQRY